MRIAFIALLLVFSACSTYSEDDLGDFDKKIGAWLVQRQLDFKKTESGLYFNFLEEGQGVKVKYTDSVKVRFKGELLSGKIFEEEKHPMMFAVKDVIVGWKEILLMSKKNAKVEIIVPPQLGYGGHELDKIPQNAILFYEIEIVDIK